MNITREQVLDWLRLTGKVLEENREYLTQLDAAIGDADHGINMERGFKKVVSQLPELAQKDLGEIFKGTGMALISSAGGASGPLYGTFFMRAAGVVAGKQEMSLADLAAVWQAGLSGVVERGRAQPGDKTMVDALTPGVEVLVKASQDYAGLAESLQLAVDAVEQGMKATIPLQAKKGRASYLGERSIGHQDPGATSSYLMIKALSETLFAER
jgi:phosphoenolpyruvate---glycerone phosphotransferase subunit DhaL